MTWRHRQTFWRSFVSLVKCSQWSKFHVNIITDFGVMSISFYKGLTRNPEIGNTPVCVLPNTLGLGRVRIPNLARTRLIKCYWMLRNARVTVFILSELFRENQQGGKITLPPPPPPPRLGLNTNPTNWSNTLKQFVGCCQRIVCVCLTISWGRWFKG